MMRYYPAFLDIKGRACLVVGGGGVATRKVDTLLECQASVTVVSLEASQTLQDLADGRRITLKIQAYNASDLEGQFLVIGATNDEALNRQISADAEARNLLCNIADRPSVCNFILPAIIQRGDLVLAISTSGKSPAFAKKLRQDLEGQFGDAYTILLELMGAIRTRLLKQAHAPEEHKPLFNKIIHSNIISLIENRQFDQIDQLLLNVLGPGYTFEALLKDERQP
jgi:precorrin-2 dehydrogenase/sirohydrochlorin ferrochelatase